MQRWSEPVVVLMGFVLWKLSQRKAAELQKRIKESVKDVLQFQSLWTAGVGVGRWVGEESLEVAGVLQI